MDKNTIIGFLLIGVVLIVFTWLNQPTPEQIEAQRRMQDSIARIEYAKQLEQQKAALETEVRLLQTDAPELKLEHFQYFAHRLLEVQAEGTEKILQLLVNQVIVY